MGGGKAKGQYNDNGNLGKAKKTHHKKSDKGFRHFRRGGKQTERAPVEKSERGGITDHPAAYLKPAGIYVESRQGKGGKKGAKH